MTIILDDICKSYGPRAVLQHFKLEIEWGRSYAFVGPEGSGKSTILKIFMGTEQADSGEVVRMGDYKYPTLHSAYIPQVDDLNPKKDAVWNVQKAHRFTPKKRAQEELGKLLPADRMNVPVSELTDAEKRLVELAKMTFVAADFLVFDEPFRGLSEAQRKAAVDYIIEMKGSRPLLIAQRDEEGLDFAKVIHMKKAE